MMKRKNRLFAVMTMAMMLGAGTLTGCGGTVQEAAGEMVQDILFHDPQKRGRDILLCTTIMAIPCIVGLVLLGRRVLCG